MFECSHKYDDMLYNYISDDTQHHNVRKGKPQNSYHQDNQMDILHKKIINIVLKCKIYIRLSFFCISQNHNTTFDILNSVKLEKKTALLVKKNCPCYCVIQKGISNMEKLKSINKQNIISTKQRAVTIMLKT